MIEITITTEDAETLNGILKRLNPAFLTTQELKVVIELQTDINTKVPIENMRRK